MYYDISTGVKQQEIKIRKYIAIGVAAILMAGAAAIPALAAPGDEGECRQTTQDALTLASSEGTRGDFTSDVIFGNEPNMADGTSGGPEGQDPGTQAGNVLPSQSPGPFVNTGANEPPRNDRGPQGFGGDELAAGINAACNL